MLKRMDCPTRITLPNNRFHRRQGIYSDHHFDPQGNIIARHSNDGKQYHLERILEREQLDGSDPAAMRRILLIDDDPYNVHYFASRGCTTLVADSPYDSARQAADSGILRALLAS